MVAGTTELKRRCGPIEILFLDVDGVLTDGGIIFDDRGVETKRFDVRDGAGIAFWRLASKRTAIVTGRQSDVVDVRAADLKIEHVRQAALEKLPPIKEILASEGLALEQACYMGDDLQDLAALRAVGLGATVPEACPEVLALADYVTRRPGGRGAVREVVEVILKAQGLWEEMIERFST